MASLFGDVDMMASRHLPALNWTLQNRRENPFSRPRNYSGRHTLAPVTRQPSHAQASVYPGLLSLYSAFLPS
jgi:hypothetical protein